ncbi:MAG: hypothetical protein LBL55_03985 [Propionibacteriaceae bacterium]|jgi:hypothetical protein|nr:hypothetical protein [Propionibacteriaceae bacterium]
MNGGEASRAFKPDDLRPDQGGGLDEDRASLPLPTALGGGERQFWQSEAMDEQNLAVNRAHWDEVAGLHRQSYDLAAFVADPDCVGKQVGGDAELLAPWLPDGSVAGLGLIHLQCHIGDDTLGWARLGARVTGLDMSSALEIPPLDGARGRRALVPLCAARALT